MAQDIKFVKLGMLVTKGAILQCHENVANVLIYSPQLWHT